MRAQHIAVYQGSHSENVGGRWTTVPSSTSAPVSQLAQAIRAISSLRVVGVRVAVQPARLTNPVVTLDPLREPADA